MITGEERLGGREGRRAECRGRGGGSPFERGVRVAVWIEQTAQFGVPCLRRGVEPAVECVLGGEDDRLSVVQPREAAARRGRDDRERPERLGLTCTTTSPEKTVSDYPLFDPGPESARVTQESPPPLGAGWSGVLGCRSHHRSTHLRGSPCRTARQTA